MVCQRCISAVEETLTKLNISYTEVKLGEARVNSSNIDFARLNKELETIGFEIIQDKSVQTVERAKALIIDYIHHSKEENLKMNFSDYLAEEIGKDYSYVSKKFSEIENLTIEKFIILQKIERVKELISYNDLNFSEIAFQLNYSSVAHLSKQFKQTTGITLSSYKKEKEKDRSTLDKLK